MDISTYENIISIAKYGSIAKAAESIFISKSSLSRQLISVEEELGIKIFNRISNKLVLTYPGRIFLETAIRIVAEEREGRKLIEDITKAHSGSILVGMPLSRSDIIMPEIIPKFHEMYPNVCIECSFRDSAEHRKSLEYGMIDIAIMSDFYMTPDLCCDFLCQDEYVLITNKDHPYAHMAGIDADGNRRPFELEWFKNDYWGFEAPGISARKISEDIFNAAGLNPHVLVDNCKYSLVIQLASVGACNLITLDTFLNNNQNLVAFSLTPRRYHTLVAARRKDYNYSKPERDFISLIQEYYKQFEK